MVIPLPQEWQQVWKKESFKDIKSDQVLRAKGGQESEEVGQREGWRSEGQGSREAVAGSGWEQGGEGGGGRVCCPVRLDACVSVASRLRRALLSRLGVGAGSLQVACRLRVLRPGAFVQVWAWAAGRQCGCMSSFSLW